MKVQIRVFTTISLLILFSLAITHAQDRLQFEARTSKSAKVTLVYRLFKPKAYTASQRYPIVVALHGVGERGNDNNIQVDREDIAKAFIADSIQNRVPHFVMVPQCPSALVWGGSADLTISDAATGITEILDSLKHEFSLDTNRFYLTGLSMGGAGTYHLLKFRPGLFAAAVPCAASGDTSAATLFSKVPIWDFHGADDAAVPVVRSRNMMVAFENRGIKVVRFVSQAPFNAPGMNAYSDAVKSGTNPVELVAKNVTGINYDSLRRAVVGGANLLYSEVTGGDHRTGWMTAYHHPLMSPWLFSKVKGGGSSVSIAPLAADSKGERQSARLVFRNRAYGAVEPFSLLGKRVNAHFTNMGNGSKEKSLLILKAR